MGTKYRFRREDDGGVVSVDFETMMGQDPAGYITLPDGVRARRVHEGAFDRADRLVESNKQTPPSDALGFTAHQLAEFEFDRKQHGFTGVEFVKDPSCPFFYQVKCSSEAERQRYIRHRGMVDRNRSSGVAMSAQLLARAEEMARRDMS